MRGSRGSGARSGGARAWMFFGAAGGLTAAVVVVLTVVGWGGSSTRAGSSGRTPASSGVGPQAYSSALSTPTFARIADRTADKAPLTSAEAFGQRTLADPVTHATLTLRDQRIDADCADAVWGRPVGEALRKGRCTQVARAVYADDAKGYLATVTIFNMADAGSAGDLVRTLAPSVGFPISLSPAFATKGFSTARGVAMGHYAVVSWVARRDGGGGATDEGLLSLLVAAGQPQAVYGRTAGP